MTTRQDNNKGEDLGGLATYSISETANHSTSCTCTLFVPHDVSGTVAFKISQAS